MKALLISLLLMSLAACSTLRGDERYWIKPGASNASDEAVSLLYYGSYVRELSSAEREREVERQRMAFVRDKSDFRRIQYTLAVLSPHAAGAERRLALQLIEPVLDGQSHAANLVALASLIDAHLLSMRRADELEKKLDAVKDIERSLMQREPPAPRAARPSATLPAKERSKP